MIYSILEFLLETFIHVINLFISKAHILIFGMLIAAVASVYLNPKKLKRALNKKAGASIFGSVTFGTFRLFV